MIDDRSDRIPMSPSRYQLGLIGAGNMAEAIARGVIRSGTFAASQVIACDVMPARRDLFNNDIHVRCVEDPASVAAESDLILLAVKPQHMEAVLASIAPVSPADAIIVSIAAGVTVARMERFLAPRPVIRTMPNTPLMVGVGAVAIAPGTHCLPEHLEVARRIFQPLAVVVDVREDQLDAVTALSGSGPAYFFYLVEHMIRAGVEMGLSPDVAATLARQTALGSATLLCQSTDTPAELRRKVTSPGGTTQAAIEHMQAHQLDQIIVAALKAAEQRGRELGK